MTKEKKIKLNPEEIKNKEKQIEELTVGIEGTELELNMLEQEIKKDLIMRKTRLQFEGLKNRLESYKKNKEILVKQLKDWN